MDNQNLLLKVRQYYFAAQDLLLYLDTHPDDKTAFLMYKDIVGKAMELKNEYEKEYGPLSAMASSKYDTFKWLECPWPWEKEANR